MKKGVIYSILTLFIIVPIILLFITYSKVLKVEGENTVVRVRADALKYFYNSISNDLDRALTISTKRSILYAIDFVVTTGNPFSDSEEKLSEMIKNGTLEGVDIPMLKGTVGFPCNTVVCWINNTKYLSEEFGFNINIDNVISVNVTPYDSWNLKVSAKMKIYLTDEYMNMSINKTLIESVKVPIIDFEDSLYSLNTEGKVSRMITRSTETPISTGEKGFGWAIGEVTRDINAENKSRKVFVTDSDLSSLDIDELNGFKAVISNQTTVPLGLTTSYLVGASIDALIDGEKIFVENVTLSVWNLNNEIDKKYYHESYFGPSFLDRLEGRSSISDKFRSQTPNVIGLLSFINFNELATYQGVVVNRTRSCVDYLYFSGLSDSLC